MPANTREIIIGFGKKKQADIATANLLAGIWRLNKLNASLSDPKLLTENDAAEFGKGHEFPTQTFITSWDLTGQIEKYLSSEFFAWTLAFGLGKSVKTGTPPNYVYTCTPLVPVTDGIELPYFSFIEAIRQGGSPFIDRMAVGCAIEDFTVTIGSGPGRGNSKIVVNFAGSGKYTEPSGITLPVATAEHLLSSASLALSIIGVDYVALKDIVSLDFGWKNNLSLADGFFPGSGFQTPGDATTGSVRGRLECGDRSCTLKFVARLESGSLELTKLKAQTTGTAVITLTYDANNTVTVTYPLVSIATAVVGDTNGRTTIAVDCLPEYHPTNGIISAVAKCTVDAIGE